MSFALTLVIAACSGFVALSYEIVWYRVYAFGSRGSPAAFGLLLGAYLLGLSLGSLASGRLCQREQASAKTAVYLSALLLAANVLGLLVSPGLGWLAAGGLNWRAGLALVGAEAALLGTTLPLLAHAGIQANEQAGARLSYVYLANIVGSVAGSLLTGFLFFDWWSIGTVSTILAGVGVGVAAVAALATSPGGRGRALWGAAMATAMLAVLVVGPALHEGLYERLLWGPKWAEKPPLVRVIENRHGVIAVDMMDLVWGGGVYDGRFNTSLVNDYNGVIRAYGVAGLHPAPRRVLVIGLSTGSWTQILANMPGVEKLTAVEINPGYLELIRRYPEVSSLLSNPKCEVVIDDGRRWLRRHPQERFDVIVMNTTFHYRAHLTNLLSTEFLSLARGHLSPGGVLFYNTTSSQDVVKTGITSFPHALRFLNFLAVSDAPLRLDRERWASSLREWKIDGVAVFDPAIKEHQDRFEQVLSLAETVNAPPTPKGLEDRASLLVTHADARVITDDNMLNEWWSPLAP